MDFFGEILFEFFMYATYGMMKNLMERLPINWNKKVLKVTCVVFSIAFWIIIAYVVIRIIETVLS